MSYDKLLPKIFDEGYCCPNAYLRLCRARHETPKEMADSLGMTSRAIRYNYHLLKQGKHPCQGRSDCMRGVIEEIEANPPPPRTKPDPDSL